MAAEPRGGFASRSLARTTLPRSGGFNGQLDHCRAGGIESPLGARCYHYSRRRVRRRLAVVVQTFQSDRAFISAVFWLGDLLAYSRTFFRTLRRGNPER